MRIRRVAWALAALLATVAVPATAQAALLINVDKSSQTMTVSENGETLYRWPVSTGIARYDTPSGAFKPFRMEKKHFSREWDDAPMPYSIFFTMQGHAIHGTNHRGLGQPASHGCVRLSVAHAAILWRLVKHEKMANTRVVLSGEIPQGAPAVAGRNDAYWRYHSAGGDDVPATIGRRSARGWREYNDGQRYYYDRNRRYYPPRRYREPGLFEFLFGR